ncbi:hypothetical protein GGR57DRAFT_292372 [Xylariaceae sp. FL1272]|nr:hypothetical protein GGR57DRAFT_292372 [Xylariaceae sp. FL1272]
MVSCEQLAMVRRIKDDGRLKLLGTARVSLNVLDFPNSHTLDADRVQRLRRAFREGGGCRPAEFANRIPALREENPFHEALQRSKVSAQLLRLNLSGDHDKLEFPEKFRHRVSAAETMMEGPTY